MNRIVLFVDDESNVLDAYRRQMRKTFKIETALGAAPALELLAERDFAVVVSDMRMPGVDGIDFLAQVARRWPNVVRVMLTGNADVPAAALAVREGSIFRFLTKPCVPEALMMVLESAVREHALLVQVTSAAAATSTDAGGPAAATNASSPVSG
jgi:DNA-binding NtrC family response regulator